MEDYLVRIVNNAGTLRALACTTTQLVNEGCRRHGTLPTAAAALGRALTGGALMGALLKTGQRAALKFEGNGPLRKILVQAESNGAVSGYVANAEVHLPLRQGKLDVGGAIGRAGFLTVTKDLGLKEPYTGMVQLLSGEIGDDLALYFTESEQIPSAVGLGVFVEPDNHISAAGGFLVQSLPPYDEEAVDLLMERIGKMTPITEQLRTGVTPEKMLEDLFAGIPYRTLDKHALAFSCSCTREKIERVLISLGSKDLADLLAEQGKVDVTCEFCRELYHFTKSEVELLLTEMG